MTNPTKLIGTTLNNGATLLAFKTTDHPRYPFIVLCSWDGRFVTWDANPSFDCFVCGDYSSDTLQEGLQNFNARR